MAGWGGGAGAGAGGGGSGVGVGATVCVTVTGGCDGTGAGAGCGAGSGFFSVEGGGVYDCGNSGSLPRGGMTCSTGFSFADPGSPQPANSPHRATNKTSLFIIGNTSLQSHEHA